VPPRGTFAVTDTQYLVTFAVMLLVGLVISGLTVRIRTQAEAAREREQQVSILARSRELVALPRSVACLVGGDFNDWRHRATAILERRLGMTEVSSAQHGKPPATYPSMMPLLRLDRTGVPRDPEQRREMRSGLLRLIAEAEAVSDEERADFMREALARVDERELEERTDLTAFQRWALVARRTARMLVLAWLGVVPWNRTHPPVDERLARIAAELGLSVAGEGREAPA